MAINIATVWEVRPGSGSDTNGGAFVKGASGTDRSQQNSAQTTFTDLVIDATTNTKLTSAAHPFAAADVGNTIQISSGTGFTVGFYQVVSVSGVIATMDRAVGTTSSTGGNGKLGGALNTVSTAVTNLVNSNTVYIKGTYTVTAAQALAGVLTSSDAGPTTFNGYLTARDDGTMATWTTATNSIDLIQFNQALGYLFKNIEFSSTAGTPGFGLVAKNSANTSAILCDNCWFHGFNKAIRGDFAIDWSFNTIVLYRCRVYSCTSHGIHNDGATYLFACHVHDNTGSGVFIDSQGSSAGVGPTLIWRCCIEENGGKGVEFLKGTDFASKLRGNMLIILQSDILDNTGDNIKLSNNDVGGFIFFNSINDGSGAWGAELVQTYFGIQLLESIAWRSNTSGDVSNITKSATDVTLTGDPFTNRAADDFSLNNTAGAGAACKAVGQPTVFP